MLWLFKTTYSVVIYLPVLHLLSSFTNTFSTFYSSVVSGLKQHIHMAFAAVSSDCNISSSCDMCIRSYIAIFLLFPHMHSIHSSHTSLVSMEFENVKRQKKKKNELNLGWLRRILAYLFIHAFAEAKNVCWYAYIQTHIYYIGIYTHASHNTVSSVVHNAWIVQFRHLSICFQLNSIHSTK